MMLLFFGSNHSPISLGSIEWPYFEITFSTCHQTDRFGVLLLNKLDGIDGYVIFVLSQSLPLLTVPNKHAHILIANGH